MFALSHAAETSAIVLLVYALTLSPSAAAAGDLEPSGPPAPTMRTLESLGFDCPDDAPDTTKLLFTFVTNQVGFDTGLSISNTTDRGRQCGGAQGDAQPFSVPPPFQVSRCIGRGQLP